LDKPQGRKLREVPRRSGAATGYGDLNGRAAMCRDVQIDQGGTDIVAACSSGVDTADFEVALRARSGGIVRYGIAVHFRL
jgi:hypothetical protein